MQRAPRSSLILKALPLMGMVAIGGCLSPPAYAQTQQDETLITAEEMASDGAAGLVTAKGHVEIEYQGYILHADQVTYNQKTDVMRAEGHVALMQPTGEVQFADAEEITGDMKQAVAENIGILFPDNSRMAARSAERYDGRWLVAKKGMYTACDVCHDDPSNPPLWQLRAEKITHDSEAHDLYYRNATVDFWGVPVLYTPYFSMPDPTVKRRQGFLTPTPGNSPNLGTFVRVPYYFDIAPNIDAVIAPTFSAEDKAQFAGEYRQRFENGSLKLNGSFAHADLISDAGVDKGKQFRGNLTGSFLHNIDNVWRAGTDVALVSDKSYLERYHISPADELVNRAYLEGFKGRDYAVVNGYYFQDIRPGSRPVEPLVLPQANFSMLGEPGAMWGGRWSLGGSTLVTTRGNGNQILANQGPDTRRLSLNTGWERRLVSDTGIVTTISGLLRGDVYSADNVVRPDNSGVYNDVLLARQFEQANIVASYPMGRHGDGYQQMLEPIIAFTASPVVKRDARQPVEDSLDVEFDETSLFTPNRFTGNDLIEGGSRAIYGLRHAITTDNNMHVDMFGGQSYSLNGNNVFSDGSGLNEHMSDYVGRLNVAPADWFDLNYGFRLNHDDLSPERQDALLSFGVPEFRPYARYISAFQTETTGVVSEVKEATFGLSSKLTDFWTFTAAHTQAFEPQPGPRTTAISLLYGDECFNFGVSVSRDHTIRADLENGTTVMVQFYLRNIGGVANDTTTRNFKPSSSE